MKIKTLAVAATFAVAGSMAGAATVSLSSFDNQEAVAGIPGQDFVPELVAAGVTDLFSGPLTIDVSDAVTLTFSLVGAESGFLNSLLLNGSEIISESANGVLADLTVGALAGETFTTSFGPGDLASVLTFEADDNGSILTFDSSDDEFGVFANAAEIGDLTTFYLALDDNGANIDDNHDDIIIRVDVAPVPLPASAFLLLAGLGGVFGMRRFRRDV